MQIIAEKPSPASEDKGIHILLVDDDQDINYTLEMLLEAEGYQVHSAVNEEQAKAIVEERRIDLSIIDYVLEDASGLEIARTLKRIYENFKIIFLSGSLEILDVVDELDFCVSKVFLKPVDIKVFLDTVHTVLMDTDYGAQDICLEKRSIY